LFLYKPLFVPFHLLTIHLTVILQYFYPFYDEHTGEQISKRQRIQPHKILHIVKQP